MVRGIYHTLRAVHPFALIGPTTYKHYRASCAPFHLFHGWTGESTGGGGFLLYDVICLCCIASLIVDRTSDVANMIAPSAITFATAKGAYDMSLKSFYL